MADHRRVEPRQIAGTGMATDPERVQQIADEAERHARAWRPQPEAAFGDVLGRAPARGEFADAQPAPRPAPDEDASAAPSTSTSTSTPTPTAPPAEARPRAISRTSPRAPDPRARLLHARLDEARSTPTPASPSTPRRPTTSPGK